MSTTPPLCACTTARSGGGASWQTDKATNGVEALERVHALEPGSAFDLCVVDINMPRMDGYSLVRELRKLDARHQAAIVMVSTEARTLDASNAFDAGANCYLVKPARAQELVLTAALLLGDRDAALKASEGVRALVIISGALAAMNIPTTLTL